MYYYIIRYRSFGSGCDGGMRALCRRRPPPNIYIYIIICTYKYVIYIYIFTMYINVCNYCKGVLLRHYNGSIYIVLCTRA